MRTEAQRPYGVIAVNAWDTLDAVVHDPEVIGVAVKQPAHDGQMALDGNEEENVAN